MKVTRDKTENSQVFLTIEVEPAEVESELQRSYFRIVKKANIPGFRKGKAPRAVLERHLGKESLLEDALDHVIPQAYENALKEQNVEAIAQPHIEIATTEPLVFKATVPIKPTVELGDYQHIQVAEEPVKLSEDDVNQTIESLRHHHATWEPVEREVKLGDMVTFDIESTIEGQSFINQKGAQYQVTSGFTGPAPGFPEQVAGMKRDEEKEFKLRYPDDYSRVELAGKEATFKVKINEIKQEVLPELNDDFAKQVDPKLESLEALRERIQNNLKVQAEERAKAEFEDKVVDAVASQAKLEYPPVLVESEIQRMINDQLRRLGGPTLEQYLGAISKTEEQLKEELRPAAVKRVTQSLVLAKVANAEKIEVSDAEIHEEIDKLKGSIGDTDRKDKLAELLDTPQSHESVEQMLITRKTVQRLVEIAKAAPK